MLLVISSIEFLNEFRTNKEFKLEENVSRNDLSKFMDWDQINAAKNVVGDDSTLLARLGREIASLTPIADGLRRATEFDT